MAMRSKILNLTSSSSGHKLISINVLTPVILQFASHIIILEKKHNKIPQSNIQFSRPNSKELVT